MDSASYQRIAAAIPASPASILFISDVGKELDAAHAAGLQTLLCVRPEVERPADSGRYRVIRTFDEVLA
jgi:enolase-phosphatase E1